MTIGNAPGNQMPQVAINVNMSTDILCFLTTYASRYSSGDQSTRHEFEEKIHIRAKCDGRIRYSSVRESRDR